VLVLGHGWEVLVDEPSAERSEFPQQGGVAAGHGGQPRCTESSNGAAPAMGQGWAADGAEMGARQAGARGGQVVGGGSVQSSHVAKKKSLQKEKGLGTRRRAAGAGAATGASDEGGAPAVRGAAEERQ
jgi:hypothetical protein